MGIAGTALISSAAGYFGGRMQHQMPAAEVVRISAPDVKNIAPKVGTGCNEGTGKISYTCPMHPYLQLNHAGNCPICGMTLVKVEQTSNSDSCPTLQVDESTQHRMGVKFDLAEKREMHKVIQAFAAISQDESNIYSVNPKVEGWIRKLNIQGTGQVIKKGQTLYELYSPELQQRQRDYVDLLTRREALLGSSLELVGPNSAMLGSLAKERFLARQRLLAADIPLDVIERLERDRRVVDVIPVRANEDGIVSSVTAHEGSYVNPMQTVFSYANNRRVWAEVTLYPDQMEWLKNGDTILLSSEVNKNVKARTRVDLSGIQIDNASKTAKLRFPLDNTGQSFIPGGYVKADISSSVRAALCVPRDALIRTGHGDFVIVGSDPTHFRNAKVTVGIEDDDNVEIINGIHSGEKIVVNAQFLLDAAGSLQSLQHQEAPTFKESDLVSSSMSGGKDTYSIAEVRQ